MSNRSSRIQINVAVSLLLAQGIYGLVFCWIANTWGPSLLCVAAIVAGIGVAMRAWWSRPLVIAVALLLIVPLITAIWRAARAGVFRDRAWPETLLIVLPGVVFTWLACFCCYVVLVVLRRPRART
jgi:hypothetical protein